mgnify:CR=1 FL=1
MNWCYYFIDLQQKAIFSKNWGGPEKDRFFLVFSGFLFFWIFSKSFLFSRGLHFCFFLLYSFFSPSSFFSSCSIVVPLPLPPLPLLQAMAPLTALALPPLALTASPPSLLVSAAVVIPPTPTTWPRPVPHVDMVVLPLFPLLLTNRRPRRR